MTSLVEKHYIRLLKMSDDKPYTITYEGASPDYTDSTFSISLDEFNPDPTSNVTFDVGSFDDGIDNWPSENQVNEMIGMYPALKIAYDKFIDVYKLVKDDYKNNRGDDEIPF
jgi:hypothetical protein